MAEASQQKKRTVFVLKAKVDRFTPKFVERYANCWDLISEALVDFQEDVVSGGFPKAEHSFTM